MNNIKTLSALNKKGNVIIYAIFSFIALILFILLFNIIPDVYDDLRTESDHSASDSFLATVTVNETLAPIGDGIRTIEVTAKNSTWLNFDGVNEYLFIPDYNYVSVVFWANNSDNDWVMITNSSDLIYEGNTTVSSLTINPFKRNATGWYFGINDSGFFGGNIDTIKFYNDTMNGTQVSELFADGR